jgi:hypothetical protein
MRNLSCQYAVAQCMETRRLLMAYMYSTNLELPIKQPGLGIPDSCTHRLSEVRPYGTSSNVCWAYHQRSHAACPWDFERAHWRAESHVVQLNNQHPSIDFSVWCPCNRKRSLEWHFAIQVLGQQSSAEIEVPVNTKKI